MITMIKFSIKISDLQGRAIEYHESFETLAEARAYGERRVTLTLSTPNLPKETPIFLNVWEEDNLSNPSFFMGRYGTSEDAPVRVGA